MTNKPTQLLCTFTTKDKYLAEIQQLLNIYSIIENKFFLFSCDDPSVFLLTYNVSKASKITRAKHTILIHRKKYTNTLYTLNAMNVLISKSGSVDANTLDWSLYKNSLVIINDTDIKIFSIKLEDIIIP